MECVAEEGFEDRNVSRKIRACAQTDAALPGARISGLMTEVNLKVIGENK